MLQVRQISKKFGNTNAVKQLGLSVQKGQIYGLLGPNGAGKSTAIRMICGVLAPTSGSIEINGVDLASYPSKAKQLLGYVPEGAPLPLELLPSEYLSHTASLYGIHGENKKKSVSEWAQRCEITSVLHKPIGSLSRGYKQRVALASALLHKPKLLVLDEPSTGLDPSQRVSFHSVLRNVADDAAVLYSSHHIAEVESSCDAIAIINHGCLISNLQCSDSKESSSFLVEVSSKDVATQIAGKKISLLKDGWVSCRVENSGEQIVAMVQACDGKIRLLQRATETLESQYLALIRESDGVAISGDSG